MVGHSGFDGKATIGNVNLQDCYEMWQPGYWGWDMQKWSGIGWMKK